ncbi:hypothetical protein [Streptomyces sp. NPDC051569]|uniref:hypothetical protein n=1 Tax=Streptomyces sp. NPDC051569 TaxID=3365661 RepID=UPI00379D0064
MSSRKTMSRWTSTAATASVLTTCAALVLTAGCGTQTVGGTAPGGWPTLKTPAVTVAYPPAFVPQGDARRSAYNAAAATLSEGGQDIGMITVQLDFTQADSAEEAAIGAEAGIALGSTPGKQTDIQVAGPQGPEEARRIDFTFTGKATGKATGTGSGKGSGKGSGSGTAQDPRINGVIIAGLDSAEKSYAVRIDAAQGKLSAGDLQKIIDSITVK